MPSSSEVQSQWHQLFILPNQLLFFHKYIIVHKGEVNGVTFLWTFWLYYQSYIL